MAEIVIELSLSYFLSLPLSLSLSEIAETKASEGTSLLGSRRRNAWLLTREAALSFCRFLVVRFNHGSVFANNTVLIAVNSRVISIRGGTLLV